MKNLIENLALLLARLTLGLGFFLAGLAQVRQGGANAFGLKFRPEWLADNVFDAYGKTLPWLELGIGALLILGLFTRVAGALLFVLVACHCATAFSAEPTPDNVFLHAATLAAFGLIITLTGGGAWALEERIGGGGKSASPDKPAKKKE